MARPLWFRDKGALKMRVEHEWPTLFIRVSGEVTYATAESLAQELRGAFHSTVSRIVLDLDEVEFIDSTGLQLLLGTAARLRQSDDRLRVRCASRSVRRMLQVTGAEAALPLTD